MNIAQINEFDLLSSPLEGTNLIEASAGTGKTYTITGLFIRLVLEKNLSVNEILVVTFTEAATEELKDRIRKRLRQAIGVFSGGSNEDAFLNGLAKRNKNPRTALRALREAVRAFDQAAIFTIHGFCRRMLHENAFESGSLFDTELVADQENLKAEIVDDFWRRHFYRASHLFVNYVLANKFTPDSLLSLLANRTAQPYLKVIPQVEIPDAFRQEKDFNISFDDVSKAWPTARAEVEEILSTDEGLSRTKYRKANIPVWIQGMDHYLASQGRNPILFKGFEKFTLSELQRAVKKDHAPPVHPFFELCETLKKRQEELIGIFDQGLLGLKARLFHYAENELKGRKKEKNIQSFDDLLLNLHHALKEREGENLARAMRRKFKAALIDEFQDTDPIQYDIFKKVFGAEENILFLIGDPKQAIYGFRGADIFAYMKAAKDVVSRHTLVENWRSEPDLITAINAIFSNAGHPFVYDEIPFQPATPAPKKYPEFLRLNGQAEPPLQLWFLEAEKLAEPGKNITKTQARALIPGAVAAEISRLLSQKGLTEGDIAVLVRTNDEARLMQEALSALHIPSVLYTTGNLFDSHEALETERVLSGITDPNSERRIKAALSTDIMGLTGEELGGLMEGEAGWEKWLDKFKTFHDLWNERGFIRMFRYLLLEEKILPRLMSLPDGERRNTNLLHLSEVLHRTAAEKRLFRADLLKWLSQQRDPHTQRLDEHQLRLESDENAVKLVTVHKSKGLEYPVVFCPFAWDGSRIEKSKEPFTFHDEDDSMRLTLDLGSKKRDQNRKAAERELLAENLRLLYVALTRAKNRCYLVWGRFNRAGTSAPAYLLHQPESWESGDVVAATGERFTRLTDQDVITELNAVVEKAGGTIRLYDMPEGPAEEYSPVPGKKEALTCRKFSGSIDREWRISSFSSLVSGRPHASEIADYDAISQPDEYDHMDLEEPVIREEPAGILSFPKGAKAGTFLHDVFEHLDFTKEDTSYIKELVAGKLREYGFELTWRETLCHMIRKVLAVPLAPNMKGLCLSRIPNENRLNELEFYFPLKPISAKKLKGIFAEYGGGKLVEDFPIHIERLDFAPVRGFMKGFIDLVFERHGHFYLVDWKSNFLGNRVEEYDQESLATVMKKEFYVLQYIIYTLALHQYLGLRLPGYDYEKHFGGVFYIFLRGVDPEKGPDYGIYRDLPSPELINALREELIDTNDSAIRPNREPPFPFS